MASPSTPAGEMLLVSPTTPERQSRLPSSKKRRITPSEEATSAKKVAVVTRSDVTLPSKNSVHRSAFGNPLGWPAMAMHAQVGKHQASLTCQEMIVILTNLYRHKTPPSQSTPGRGAKANSIICTAHQFTIRSSSQPKRPGGSG